jgi:hypothetical protein
MHALARSITLTGSNQAARSSASVYVGFTIRETAGAVAVVRIWDNASAASGTVLEQISLAANESRSECYARGVWAELGVYVEVVSGTVAGSVRIG